jgi:hypothetical protein
LASRSLTKVPEDIKARLAAPIMRDNDVKFSSHITRDHRVITFASFVFGGTSYVVAFITPDDAGLITPASSKIQVRT